MQLLVVISSHLSYGVCDSRIWLKLKLWSNGANCLSVLVARKQALHLRDVVGIRAPGARKRRYKSKKLFTCTFSCSLPFCYSKWRTCSQARILWPPLVWNLFVVLASFKNCGTVDQLFCWGQRLIQFSYTVVSRDWKFKDFSVKWNNRGLFERSHRI